MAFYNADCPRIVIENPVPMKCFGLPKYSQVIEPYYFGDPWKKRTCLWIKGVPPLFATMLVEWTKAACFDLLHKHGVGVNPLYKLGCGRVGCMPCIMARKAEIREMAARFPEHVDKLREWERIASLCSKRGKTTFFPSDTIPGEGDTRADIDSVVEWSKTGRGGMQYSMEALMEPPACSSLYGLCE